MKRPEEVKLEFTREWVRKAENDFLTAQHLFKGGERYVNGTAFHAQQAAEKYLKAFLVWHQIEFKKTHDIAALLKLASEMDSVISDVLSDAVHLTPYGVEYRYPGDYPDVTMDDAKKALNLAVQVRKEIRYRLPEETFSRRLTDGTLV